MKYSQSEEEGQKKSFAHSQAQKEVRKKKPKSRFLRRARSKSQEDTSKTGVKSSSTLVHDLVGRTKSLFKPISLRLTDLSPEIQRLFKQSQKEQGKQNKQSQKQNYRKSQQRANKQEKHLYESQDDLERFLSEEEALYQGLDLTLMCKAHLQELSQEQLQNLYARTLDDDPQLAQLYWLTLGSLENEESALQRCAW